MSGVDARDTWLRTSTRRCSSRPSGSPRAPSGSRPTATTGLRRCASRRSSCRSPRSGSAGTHDEGVLGRWRSRSATRARRPRPTRRRTSCSSAASRSTWSSTSPRCSRARTRSCTDDIEAVVDVGRAGQRRRGIVKVILETGYLSAGDIERGCHLAVEAGADFVKTSTGFGPRGASVDDVRDHARGRRPRHRRQGRRRHPRPGHRARDARGRRDAARDLGGQRDPRRGDRRAGSSACRRCRRASRSRRADRRAQGFRDRLRGRSTTRWASTSRSRRRPASSTIPGRSTARVPLQLHAAAVRVPERVRARAARAASGPRTTSASGRLGCWCPTCAGRRSTGLADKHPEMLDERLGVRRATTCHILARSALRGPDVVPLRALDRADGPWPGSAAGGDSTWVLVASVVAVVC